MTRCDYDGVFYRVLCVTLLAIAFVFTVILTNVFVDLDGLLAGKQTDKNHEESKPQELIEESNAIEARIPEIEQNNMFYQTVDKPEIIYNDMKGFEDDNEDAAAYRTKRSLDSSDFQFRIKDPKMKKILTTRLAQLLEDIDGEEEKVEGAKEKGEKLEESPKNQVETIKGKKRNGSTVKERIESTKNDLLHLAMHNILLQGIIGHMDLNEIYQKVHSLVQNFDHKTTIGVVGEGSKKEGETKTVEDTTRKDYRRSFNVEAPKLLIKTVIDIQSLDKGNNKENDTNSKEAVKGVIKLIYNGKSVKLNQIDNNDDFKEYNLKSDHLDKQPASGIKVPSKMYVEVDELSDIIKDNIEESHLSDSIFYDAVLEYFSKHLKAVEKYKNKRLKRNVKVRVVEDTTTQKAKPLAKHGKTDEEELYVEIETHFDGKGIKGEKKRKLVRSIIDKIQKAIHTDLGHIKETNKPKRLHIKKRTQNPLDPISKNVLVNKVLVPVEAVVHRELDPISKTYAPAAGAPYYGDKSGDTWKKAYARPHFFSAAKAINSAEMGEIDVHVDPDSKTESISQRLQKPLNSEIQDIDAASFYQLGNLKFYIKEIDGTGFSIGFNQYLGEAPDEESMKSFTGIDNLLKTYQDAKAKTEVPQVELPDSEEYHDMRKREITRHTIVRRAVDTDNDYHSNEYKIIFNNNFLPYDSYQEIIEDRNKKVHLSLSRQSKNDNDISNLTILDSIHGFKQLPLIVDDDIFEKDLRPSEIFSLASLLGRTKRSIKVQKYTKVNTKSRLNRYINTNMMAPKRLFLKNKQLKRSKRQLDNIRIFTAENLPLPRQPNSNENIFVTSDENMFADRTLVRDIEQPEHPDQLEPNPEEPYTYIEPYNPPRQSTYLANLFGPRSRHNPLMSKYPHIFMEEISRSKEDIAPENPYIFNNYVNAMIPAMQKLTQQDYSMMASTTVKPVAVNYNVPRVKELVDAISPRTNYKLTVKILPKNASGLPSGFKEVHTSINKSISKNGLIFSSLVNVSAITKVEKIPVNKTDSDLDSAPPPSEPETIYKDATISPLVKLIRKQQEKMKNLLKQHKQKIDAQLDHLNQEKATIETIIFDKVGERHEANTKNNNDLIDVLLPSDPPQLLHLTKNEAGQLITSALMKLHDAPNVIEIQTPPTTPKPVRPKRGTTEPTTTESTTTKATTTESTTTEPTTTKPTTSQTEATTKIDTDKIRILKTIQQNENLTNTILTKIDKNTEILQRFLQKFAEKMEMRNSPVTISRRSENEINKVKEAAKVPIFYKTNWKDNINEPFFKQNIPDLEVIKNDTRISIPFVYAYQQPYSLANNVKPNNPIASVVYQGHIHTNAVRKVSPNNNKPNTNTITNNDKTITNTPVKTKFFIDSIEDNYKLNEYKLRHKGPQEPYDFKNTTTH